MASRFHAPPISSLIHSWEDFFLNLFEPTVLLQLFNFFRSRNPQGVKECCDYLFLSVLRSDVTNHLRNVHIFRLSLTSLPADICLCSTSAR